MNSYNNKNIFHPLIREELILIDKVWNFINDFKEETLTKSEYVNKIINKIKSIYSPIDFLVYELIVEKIYWNLFDVIVSKIHVYDHIKEHVNKDTVENEKKYIIRKLLKKSLIGKSSLRKAFIYSKKHNSFMYKYNYPNDLDLLLFSIMANRSTYETIMSNENITLYEINSLVVDSYNSVIEFDYPFPNFNTIKPFTSSMKERMHNIKEMYFYTNASDFWTI
jgi:predicted transcriptional regulator